MPITATQIVSGRFANLSRGEMSLLTGEPRSATIVALTEIECYRLDAQAFRRLLERRSDLAAKMASQLAERLVALISSREELANHQTLVAMKERGLLDKIRSYFPAVNRRLPPTTSAYVAHQCPRAGN